MLSKICGYELEKIVKSFLSNVMCKSRKTGLFGENRIKVHTLGHFLSSSLKHFRPKTYIKHTSLMKF